MTADYRDTDEFRDARFTHVDLSGATFRDCDLRRVKVVDSWLTDLNVSGELGSIRVNDVDVTGYVEGELDRRHPERVQVRDMSTTDDYRAAWAPSNACGRKRSRGPSGCPNRRCTSGWTTNGRWCRPFGIWCSPPTPGCCGRCSTSLCRTTRSV